MFNAWSVLAYSFAYLCLLFLIAYYADRRAGQGRSIINNPYVYALSLAVYCTSWTFYGSVGRAALNGLDFLPIYLGPTLVFVLWPVVLLKIVRIARTHRTTSIADFIASRYGKSHLIGGIVTVIAVVSVLPYIALQLKAVSVSLTILVADSWRVLPAPVAADPDILDPSLPIAALLIVFTILFGTRNIDASEHHEGMVAAIAFESLAKLLAFLAVGVFVTYVLYDGMADLFGKGAAFPELDRLYSFDWDGGAASWVSLTLISMAAAICLPRQFQVTVVENQDERHLAKAGWLFPLYLLLINIFVLPIALGGLLQFGSGSVDGDAFMLALPMSEGYTGIAFIAYLGGLSAATGMVIVATIALSTMVCNDLVMPALLRSHRLHVASRRDVPGLLLFIRRAAIVLITCLGFLFYKTIGESYALVTIGLVSFVGVAQIAPSIIGGIFWKRANATGALGGLLAGFLMWLFTLLLPAFARSGWLPVDFIEHGLFGLAWLRPYALFGLDGYDVITHSVMVTLSINITFYVVLSLATRPGALERVQATLFVDVFRLTDTRGTGALQGTTTVGELRDLLRRFLGATQANLVFEQFAVSRGATLPPRAVASPELVAYCERQLAGAVGSASAQVMIGTVMKGEAVQIDDVLRILTETSEVIEYSHRLEEKSAELEQATARLRAANERLLELDRMKDEFISTISHELRTPLTAIRSFGEILRDNPDVPVEQRGEFVSVIVSESERLTRLIDQILDLSRLEAGRMEWQMAELDSRAVLGEAVAATRSLFREGEVRLEVDLPETLPAVYADRDRLIQVVVNLISNAVKFCRRPGTVALAAEARPDHLLVHVDDDGPGVAASAREAIFEKFTQADAPEDARPAGTGLGLAICRQIVEHFGGEIWVDPARSDGARFSFRLPLTAERQHAAE